MQRIFNIMPVNMAGSVHLKGLRLLGEQARTDAVEDTEFYVFGLLR